MTAGLTIVLISIANNNIPIPLNSFFIAIPPKKSICFHLYYNGLGINIKTE